MSNVYNQIPKRVPGVSSSTPNRRFGVAVLLFGFIGIGAIGLSSTLLPRVVAAGFARLPAFRLENPGRKPDRLYVLSDIVGPDGTSRIGSRVTTFDLATRQQLYATEGMDAMPAPDGSRLYVVGPDPAWVGKYAALPRDQLFALDTRTGKELWRVPIQDRVQYMLGDGPSTLAISPDNRWLLLYKYPVGRLSDYPNASKVPFWIEIIDARTGQVVRETDSIPGCDAATLAVAPTGGTLYVTCHGRSEVHVIDLRTGKDEQQLRAPGAPTFIGIQGGIAGSTLSPDGRSLYVVSDNLQVAIIDVAQRTIARSIDLPGREQRAVVGGLVALAADGSTLFVGQRLRSAEDGAASGLWLYDTRTWREIGQVRLEQPIHRNALALGADGRSVYGVVDAPLAPKDAIVAVTLDQANRTYQQARMPLARKAENIRRIFIGP